MRRSPVASVALSLFVALVGACGEDGTIVPMAADAGTEVALPPLETVAPAIVPLAKRKDAASSPIIFDAERGRVWTSNGDVGTVSYVDIDAPRVLAEIPAGKDVRSVALSPDARWIAAVDREGGTVTLIDAESRQPERTLALGTHPRAVVWDSANPRYFYVTLEDEGSMLLVDRMVPAVVARIPVGRLPAGVAVSRTRREVYVTHRIDGRISVVDLKSRAAVAEVPIADEPAAADTTKPQGRPFAFESLAWAPDGNVAWLPHELLAPTHPFRFKETLFPAISVVDLDARAEVTTDPASTSIAGRKNLFDAIKYLDPTGNLSVLSQPCAAAFHPKGIMAYALACGSEDLMVFDAVSGNTVDVVRDLPGDHPIGLALDDLGQRAWILADQSHTLTMVDLAEGSPVHRVRVVGTPLSLVARDPVDPETREGLKLWFRANSSKGLLATTGNNWMSCAGCHLDGLVSTNLVFFEALPVKDATADAQIGHVGLADLFSTTPKPDDPRFNPHDILVALRDQGGLAPDRTGAKRLGEIDPAAPTADARTIASRLARVVARDLPIGPSWLLASGAPPSPTYDGAWCGGCHKAEYDAWAKSAHAHAGKDPMMRFGARVEVAARGSQYTALCAGCHDPVSARLGDTTLVTGRGVTCIGCHDVTRAIEAEGNADLEATTHDWTADHKARGLASLELLRSPTFCGGCHQQFVPGTGLEAISTLREWREGPYGGHAGAEATTCVDCHMTKTAGVANHETLGGNVYLASIFTDAAFTASTRDHLRSAITMEAAREGDLVRVTLHNRAGHDFPTGVTDVREPWVELQAVDAAGKVIARYGGPDDRGLIPRTAARLGMDIARPDGTVLVLHELSETTRLPFVRRIPPGGSLVVSVPAPATLPLGATSLDAVLLYRNVSTPYFRAATGAPTGVAPETEVGRTRVP